MFQYLLSLFLVVFAQAAGPSLSSPISGQILRGQVEIVGNLDVPNFSSAELEFKYASDAAGNWFSIQTFSQPITDGTLAVWDTTLLTDGDYTLRLRVFLLDGSFQDVLVPNILIGNDVPLPTATPTLTVTPSPTIPLPIIPSTTPSPLPDAVTNVFPSPTPLTENPVAVTTSSIYLTFGRGALITLGLFILFSLLLRLRRA